MSKLTPEITEQICKLIRIGVPYIHAAQATGICEKTFYNWMNRNVQFLQSVKKAESESIARDVALIEKAAQEGKWQAGAWRLERRHPEEFATKVYQNVEVPNAIKIKFVIDDGKTDNNNSNSNKTIEVVKSDEQKD